MIEALLGDPEIRASLGLSLSVSTVATAIVAGVGTPLAYGLALLVRDPGSRAKARSRAAIDALLLLPTTLPPTVIGYGLLVLFGARGALGAFLERLGVSIVFSWTGAVLASAVVALPLYVRVAASAFEDVGRAHVEMARTLGYGGVEILMRVVVPLARRGLVAGLALAFCRALGEFGATLVLAGNIPGRTATMPLALYTLVSAGDWERANALALALVVLSAVFLAMARLVEDRLDARGRLPAEGRR